MGDATADAENPDAADSAAGPRMFVSNFRINPDNVIDSFSTSATGNATPVARIEGASTMLDGMIPSATHGNYPIGPTAIVADTSGNLWALVGNANAGTGGAILEFKASGTGNVAPAVNLTGAATTFQSPASVYVDAAGRIVVADLGTNTVDVFSPGANGNVAPVQVIDVSATGSPWSAVTDGAGDFLVAYKGTTTGVAKFASNAQGAATPVATISGSNTGIGYARAVALDSSGNIWVGDDNYLAYAIEMFSAGAMGNVAPAKRIVGPATTINRAIWLAVDASGRAYLATYSKILVFAAGADGNVAPAQTLLGDNGNGFAPAGVAVH
jgi:hypothetical protein